jgi:general secretion pathway protein G
VPGPRWLRWFQPGPIAFVIAALVMWALVSVSGPSGPRHRGRHSKTRRAELQLYNLATAIDMYMADTQELPDSLQTLTQTTEKIPEPYIQDVPSDPWGNPYAYRMEGSTYDLRSAGKDGRLGNADDVVVPSWK